MTLSVMKRIADSFYNILILSDSLNQIKPINEREMVVQSILSQELEDMIYIIDFIIFGNP